MTDTTRDKGINWNDTDEEIAEHHNLTINEVSTLRATREQTPNRVRRWLNRLTGKTPDTRQLERTAPSVMPAEPAPESPPAAASAIEKPVEPAVTKLPAATRRKKRAAWGTITLEEWSTLTTREIAERMGVTISAVQTHRATRGLPRAPRKRPPGPDWSALTLSDWETIGNQAIAEKLGVSRSAVVTHRKQNNLPKAPRLTRYDWSVVTFEQWNSLSNAQIAKIVGAPTSTVANRRRSLTADPQSAPAYAQRKRPAANWSSITDEEWASLNNQQIADKLGMSNTSVLTYRKKHGKPANPAREGQTPWHLITDEEWATLNNPQIGEKLGVNSLNVLLHRRRENLPAPEKLLSIDVSLLSRKEWAGITDKAAARKYGVSPTVVKRHREEHGLPPSPRSKNTNWDSITKEEWETLNNGQIATKLGVTPGAVKTHRATQGLPPSPHPNRTRTKTAWDTITDEEWAARNNRQIAKKLGVTVKMVLNHRKNHNKPANPARRDLYDWSAISEEEWATLDDAQIADKVMATHRYVAQYRRRRNLPQPAEHQPANK